MIFMFLVRNFIWAYLPISISMSFTQILYTHITWCFLMIYFHEYYMSYIDFECWWLCDFQVSWIYSCFIPFLKDFVLVYKFFIKLVRILHFGRVFKFAKLILKLIFENPYLQRAVGWAIMPCMLLIENPFQTCAWKGSSMSYILDLHHVFQLVSQLIFLVVYSCLFFLYMYVSNI